MTAAANRELDALVRREHANPHAVLGVHPADGGVIVRVLRPAATGVEVIPDQGARVTLAQVHPGGVFEGLLEGAKLPLHYRLKVDYADGASFEIEDPYAFLPTLGELDLHLIGEGRHE
jgi:1,4-alpha-glucan branching enzyme